MEFVELILSVIWLLFWFYIGMKLFDYFGKRAKKYKTVYYDNIPSTQITAAKCYLLKTEVHGDMIYAYDKQSDTFAAQGKTLDEVADSCFKYKKISLAFVEHDGLEYWFINGMSTKVKVKLL